MTRGAVVLASASLVLAACQPPVKNLRVDSSLLQAKTPAAASNACHYRLKEVVDGRSKANAGGLDFNQLTIEDAPDLVRTSLLQAGLLSPDAVEGRDVSVRLRQIYLTQNRYTKVPVVVYSVQADGLAEFVIRAQPTNMNWAGSENEALASIRRAIQVANTQLLAKLNESCTG